jgi:hypothetical protein
MTGDYGLQDKISTIEYADASTTESYDDWEESGIYGGDLTYCPICDTRLKYDEDGDHYCPKCKKDAHSLSMKRRTIDKNNRDEDNLTEGFWKDFIGIFKELGRNETKRFKTEQEAKTWIEKTISPKKIDKWYKPFYSKSTFGIGDWCVNYNTKDFRMYDKDYKEEETKKPVNNKTNNQNNSDESGTPPKAGNMAREDDTIMPRKRERVLAAYQPDNNANLSLKEAQAKEYEYSTETVDGTRFSIYHYTTGPKAGKVQISSLHPYDDADYHWAVSKNNGTSFAIYIESPGKYVETFMNDSLTYDKVMARLNELDRAKKIKPRMVHN